MKGCLIPKWKFVTLHIDFYIAGTAPNDYGGKNIAPKIIALAGLQLEKFTFDKGQWPTPTLTQE